MRLTLTRLGSLALIASTLAGSARGQIFVDAEANGAGDGSSWADAYTELSDALDSIGQGKTIWVAEGRYTPGAGGASGPNTTFFLPTNTRLFGGFDGTETALAERAGLFQTTILSGDHLGDDEPNFSNRSDNSLHVVTNDFFVREIDGFTVEGGNAVGSRGGAIYGPNLGACPVRNCTFRDNEAGDTGGALYMVVGDGLEVTHCEFIGNRAQFGGASYVDFIDLAPRFESCRFVGNIALQSGGALQGSAVTVKNSEFIGNRVPPGGLGGAALAVGGVALAGCTLVHNTALGSSEGGAVLTSGGSFESSILWNNRDDDGTGELSQVRPFTPGTPLFGFATACLIQGWSGTLLPSSNVLVAQPLFVDALGADGISGTLDDDVRLAFGSPAIDAGLDAALAGIGTDVAGLPRFVQSLTCGVPASVDIGAHEHPTVQGTTAFCPQPPSSLGVPIDLTGPCFASAGDSVSLSAGPIPGTFGTFFLGEAPVAQPFGSFTICAGRRFVAFSGQLNGNQLELDLAPGAISAGTSVVVQAAIADQGALALSSAIVLTVAD